MLDPLWSSELTEIEHDGCEATRVDKAAYVSGYELPMDWLRVCHKNPDSVYNCGRCEKCLRTMITLRIVGALERCKTFPNDLDFKEVANMPIPDNLVIPRQNLEALERLGTEPELARALSEALNKSSIRNEEDARRAERVRLEQQLSRAHKQLERTRAKLEASKKRAQRMKARGERLAEHNLQLTARCSARRYTLADAVVDIALRVPKIGKLVRRGKTAENR